MAIPSLNLSDLTGINGFKINGVTPYDTSGYFVSDAGDINGDGIKDAIIGAPGFNGSNPDATDTPGNAYVVFGNPGGFPADFELSALDGTNGFVIQGIKAKDATGWSVSDAGDVNGDGVGDAIIGAIYADPNGLDKAGSAYVVYGSKSGFAPTLNLADLNGTNGFRIDGSGAGDQFGRSVSSAGDINGDGFADVIIGADDADLNGLDNVGKSYVVFGTDQGIPPILNVSDLNGTNGFTIEGIAEGDNTGIRVSDIGDFNNDGIDDVAVSAPSADPNGNIDAGSTYVIYGTQAGFAPTLNLSELDGTNGFVINGKAAGDLLGAVSSAGDINGDGIADLTIGAYLSNGYAGTSYVVFGSAQPFPDKFNLSELNGTNGFAVEGIAAGDLSGYTVSGAGDFNGDKVGDLLIGAPGKGNFAGESYLLFGKKEGFSAKINLSELDGTDGFALSGVKPGDFSAISVSATDINGDGLSDLMIGASYGDPKGKTNAGETYVIYGHKDIIGGAGNNTLNGTVSDDTIYGRSGNDKIFGSEGFNMLFGEDGNDLICGGSGTDWLVGGKGNDDIFGAEGNNQLFGNEGNDKINSGSGDDWIDGGTGNDRIWLGGGNDIVALAIGNGVDTIHNFQPGQTKFGLSDDLKFEDLNIVSRGNSTLIEVAATGEDLARIQDMFLRIDGIAGESFVSI